MNVERYIKYFLGGLTGIVLLITGWGIYVNVASNLNIEDKLAKKYVALRVEKAGKHAMKAVLNNVDTKVTALWKSDIEAEMTGTISKVYVKEGDKVEEGQPLCEITNHDILGQIAAAEASIAEAQADYVNALQRANRYIELVEYDAVSRIDYDTAIASRDAAQARLNNRIAQREILETQKGKLVVKAPGKGTILKTYTKFGAYIKQGQPLVLMAATSDKEAIMVLSEKNIELLDLKKNDGKVFVLEVRPETLVQRAYPYFGAERKKSGLKQNQFLITVTSITPEYNDENMAKKVIWKFVEGGEILEPTMYQNTRLIRGNSEEMLSVPIEAVNDFYNNHDNYVFTIDENNCLVKRFVETGVFDETYVEIKSGLTEGELVVVSDVRGLEHGMRVKPELVETGEKTYEENSKTLTK